MIRQEFTGMLPAAIDKFEQLLEASKNQNLDITVIKGFDGSQGQESYFCWGCAIQVICINLPALKALAESLGIIYQEDTSNSANLAYTNNLDINDFKTYRVNGNLELTPEKKMGE